MTLLVYVFSTLLTTQIDSTDLIVTVVDSSGAVLQGAEVMINQSDELQRRGVANADGEVRFIGLRPGVYELVAVLEGFTTVREMVNIFPVPSMFKEPRRTTMRMEADLVPVGEPSPQNELADASARIGDDGRLRFVLVEANDTLTLYRNITSHPTHQRILAVIPLEVRKSIVVFDDSSDENCSTDVLRVDDVMSDSSLSSNLRFAEHPNAFVGIHPVSETAYLMVFCRGE